MAHVIRAETGERQLERLGKIRRIVEDELGDAAQLVLVHVLADDLRRVDLRDEALAAVGRDLALPGLRREVLGLGRQQEARPPRLAGVIADVRVGADRNRAGHADHRIRTTVDRAVVSAAAGNRPVLRALDDDALGRLARELPLVHRGRECRSPRDVTGERRGSNRDVFARRSAHQRLGASAALAHEAVARLRRGDHLDRRAADS